MTREEKIDLLTLFESLPPEVRRLLACMLDVVLEGDARG